MALSKSAAAIKTKIEQGQQEQLSQKIPASAIRDQLLPINLGPRGDTGSGYTPAGHASSHQHGGADEVATATPSANAIPKAGAGSTLADGWLSSAISRITSIALTAPSQFSVAGSPLTANGTLTLAWATASANVGLFGPASGGAAAPTFRALVAADIPALDTSHLTTGTLAAARGGTGVSNAGTLTNASNTTITGGGTIALGGFTLTAPATGTAALRESAATAGRIGFWSDAQSLSHGASLTWDNATSELSAGYLVATAPLNNGSGILNPFFARDSGGNNRTVFGLSADNPPDTIINMVSTKDFKIVQGGNVSNVRFRFLNAGALEIYEMTAPAAPAANGARIFAVDNGAGKTVLKVIFASGAAQVIATEP